jgi:hypothetical protein
MMAHKALVRVTPELISEMCKEDWRIPSDDTASIKCLHGVPSDAKYIRSFYDSKHDCFVLVFEHPSFVEAVEGDEFPVIKVVYQRESIVE